MVPLAASAARDRRPILVIDAGQPEPALIAGLADLFEVRVSHTLPEAVARLCDEEFACVILNLSSFDANGFDTLVMLVSAWPQLPLIAITACEDVKVARDALHAGAEDYLSASELEGIARSVEFAIERKRGAAALAGIEERYAARQQAWNEALARQVERQRVLARIGERAVAARQFDELLEGTSRSIVEHLRGCLEAKISTLPPVGPATDAFSISMQSSTGLSSARRLSVAIRGAQRHGRIVAAFGDASETQAERRAFIQAVAKILATGIERVKDESTAAEQLLELANSDPLTGLPNRRAFRALGVRELVRSARYDHPLAVGVVDLDGFKQINDRHGHQVGDLALMGVASLLRENLRETDLVGRWGGDEFAVMLPDTRLDDACEVIQRVLHRLSRRPISGVGRMALSVGLVASNGETDLDEVIDQADRVLYRVKRSGGGRVLAGTGTDLARSVET